MNAHMGDIRTSLLRYVCVNDAYLNCHQSKLTVPLMLVKQR